MWGKVRAMLNATKLPWKIRNKLWAQCAKHWTDLENIFVKKVIGHLMKEFSKRYLNGYNTYILLEKLQWYTTIDIQSKLCNRGNICIYVGIPPNHAKEVCPFLSLITNKLVLSRSYSIMNLMYDKYFNSKKEEVSNIKSDEDYNLKLEEFYPKKLENMVNLDEEEEEGDFNNQENLDDFSDDSEDEDNNPNTSLFLKRGRELQNLQT
jgi:hypothetical protein